VLDAFSIRRKTDSAPTVDRLQAHALGLKPAGGVSSYAPPAPNPRPHELGMLGRELGNLSRGFGGPAECGRICGEALGLRPRSRTLLCWPHHFDMRRSCGSTRRQASAARWGRVLSG